METSLDPKDLNKAIKQRYHKIPTVKEVTHEFPKSIFFSKLDPKLAFWCVALGDESFYLTTFGTIFGRYRYLVMSYGSIDSQDAFQAKMDHILGLEEIVSIADDIVLHGVTEEQHDDNMRKLMDRAHENGLIFSPDKCSLKADSVMFFGCLYDKNGIRSDPAKVEAI